MGGDRVGGWVVTAVVPVSEGPSNGTVVFAECVGKLVELVGHVGSAWAEVGWSAPPTMLGWSSSGGGVMQL